MARQFQFSKKKKQLAISIQNKWIKGLDTLVSPTEIKPDELAEATDIQLVEDGKIQCPRDGQNYYGSSSGSRVVGKYSCYKSDGTRELLRRSGTVLQKHNTSTDGWDNISGFTYTSAARTEGVMAYDRLYLVNPSDNLTYYDFSSIVSFTSISAPSTPTVTRTGSAGTYTYSYKITAVTATGETTASSAGSTTLNMATLDSTNYMTVTWSAVTNAIGYNIYGRKDGAWYFIIYIEGNGSGTAGYADKGTVTPSELVIPPTENTTAGPKGVDIELYKDSLFVVGDTTNPSRLYYSAGGDLINDFSAANGGGFIDISKNDGQKGTSLKVFKNSLVVFKENSVYQFSFSTSGAPQVTQVTSAVGCIATRSVVAVENDLYFSGDRGVFSIGNQAGFAFDVLRTNEISARVRSVYQTIDPAYIQNIAAHYATVANKNLLVISYTPSGSTYNSKALVFDVERGGWYKWTNIQANCWTTYTDTSGNMHVLYGDDNSGYTKEILTGTDDFGSNISGSFKLKSESFGDIARYKTIKDLSVVLRQPVGSVNLSVIVDGTTTAYQTNASTVSPSVNFGHYIFTEFLFAESSGTGSVTSSNDIVLRTKRNLNIQGKTFQLAMDNGSSGASFTLLDVKMTATPRSDRYRQSTDLIS